MIIKRGKPTLMDKIEQNFVPVSMFVCFLLLIVFVVLLFGPFRANRWFG